MHSHYYISIIGKSKFPIHGYVSDARSFEEHASGQESGVGQVELGADQEHGRQLAQGHGRHDEKQQGLHAPDVQGAGHGHDR